MKQIIYTIGLFIVATSAFGQLSKEEEKQILKQMKSQTPEQYVLVKEELSTAKKKVIELETELEEVKAEKVLLETEVKDYMAATQASKLRIEELEAARHEKATALVGVRPTPEEEGSSSSSSSTTQSSASNEKAASGGYGSYAKSKTIPGVVYKVQIGAFRNYDITKYFNRHDNFSGTVDADGTMRYTLGSFSDYWEADKFKAYLRGMGVNGAWVVAYKDGQRISMKDAREGTF